MSKAQVAAETDHLIPVSEKSEEPCHSLNGRTARVLARPRLSQQQDFSLTERRTYEEEHVWEAPNPVINMLCCMTWVCSSNTCR